MNDQPVPILRTARPEDIEALLDFWLRAEVSPTSTESAADVRELLERDPDALIVAEVDGEVVGTLMAGWDGWRATFYRLAVDTRPPPPRSRDHLGPRRRGALPRPRRQTPERDRRIP